MYAVGCAICTHPVTPGSESLHTRLDSALESVSMDLFLTTSTGSDETVLGVWFSWRRLASWDVCAVTYILDGIEAVRLVWIARGRLGGC